MATNENNIKHAHYIILPDRLVTTAEVVHYLQISYGSAYRIIHNRLGFHNTECAQDIVLSDR
jgi:hypothetical protein